MLSEQEKKEMLADAKDMKRREAFRQAKSVQENRALSLKEYCAFIEQVRKAFPTSHRADGNSGAKKFLL